MDNKLFRISCTAKQDVFNEDWDKIPKEDQDIINEMEGLSCSGDGKVDPSCYGCSYVTIIEIDES